MGRRGPWALNHAPWPSYMRYCRVKKRWRSAQPLALFSPRGGACVRCLHADPAVGRHAQEPPDVGRLFRMETAIGPPPRSVGDVIMARALSPDGLSRKSMRSPGRKRPYGRMPWLVTRPAGGGVCPDSTRVGACDEFGTPCKRWIRRPR